MDKATRLDYSESVLTHAMVFLGVNLVDGKPNRWKVENSWGTQVGFGGFYVMEDSFLDTYSYQFLLHKKYLSEQMLEELNAEPIRLESWDPIGF